jgi:hypothetical protein
MYKILVIALCTVLMGCKEKPKSWNSEWHGSCRVAVSLLQPYFKNIKFNKEHGKLGHQQIGNCEAEHIKDNLWFVKGFWLSKAMELDGISPINFEAVMFEDNNQRDKAVKKYGTQYLFCGVAINGKDASGIVHYVHCRDGGNILEFKTKHGL